MQPVTFGMVGGGWRAEFFLRVARELPARFRISGVLVRDAAKGAAFEQRWNVPAFRTLDEVLSSGPKFVVVSVPWSVSPQILRELAERRMPALAETPPAPDLDGLIELHRLVGQGARLQVAEQYHLQPLHAARESVARAGKLGTVTQAQLSIAHGYHGLSLMRRLLNIGFENATITARSFTSPLVAGPNRAGPPREEKIVESRQILAHFDFGDRLGVFDFTGDQYFSWVRTPRLLVRGERGEINNTSVTYLRDFQTPISLDLRRENAGENGNLEGYFLKGILLGDEWIYRNPFAPARLTDDEIAVASCLQKMADYVDGAPPFYALAEAAQDHYLNLMLEQALTTQQPVTTTTQPWATDRANA